MAKTARLFRRPSFAIVGIFVAAGISGSFSLACIHRVSANRSTSTQAPVQSVPTSPESKSPSDKQSSARIPKGGSNDGGKNTVNRHTQDYVNAMLAKTAQLRGLAPKKAVKAVQIDRVQARRQIETMVARDIPKQAIESEKQLLRTFGLIPEDYDYERETFRLLSSQIAGYFDASTDTMYLLGDMSRNEEEITLAHELVHALQNQHFDLGNRIKYRPDFGDSLSAIHGLAEGDATSLMLDYAGLSTGVKAVDMSLRLIRLQMKAAMILEGPLNTFPKIMRDSLLAPYIDGIGFVNTLRKRGGWALVDQAWRRPPTTTEQLRHVDKWMAGEPAVAVATPNAPEGEGWKLIQSETIGEQGLCSALEQWLSARAAEQASAGWGGDRTAIWENPQGDTIGAWHVRFDRQQGTDWDFEAKQAIESLSNQWEITQNEAACHVLDDGRQLGALRKGLSVVIVTEVLKASSAPMQQKADRMTQPKQTVKVPVEIPRNEKESRQHDAPANAHQRCKRLLKWAASIAAE